MNEIRLKMDRALKSIALPKLREAGFAGAFPHLRRISGSEIQLLTFQFDRNGGGFVIEVATAANQPFKTSWGKQIEPTELTAHDINKRIRIHPTGILQNSSTEDWFRFDKSEPSETIYLAVANQVIGQIALIDDVFLNIKAFTKEEE